MAVTTSFHNSGLSDILLPEVNNDLDIKLQLLIVGTGQALKLGQSGDVDAILVHSKKSEVEFINNGYGTHRREIMYNDFIILGPQNNPADMHQSLTALECFQRLSQSNNIFISRGDESGTHKREKQLWKAAGIMPSSNMTWYRSVGASMGAALNIASALDAYILADRASWLNFKNKGNLAIACEGDPAFFNQYAFIPVDSNRHPHINSDLVQRLENWLVSNKAKVLINNYKIAGQQLFTFNAVSDIE